MFASTLMAIVVCLAGFNILTDPFGIFGDVIFDWTSYNATNNPRTAKITYLDEHHGEYDSYIIGCSSTSSFTTESLNEVFGANFYNLIMYGADMLDCEDTARYIIKNYEVKNIVLNVYLDNGVYYADEPNEYTHSMLPRVAGSEFADTIGFYARYLFANPSYGTAKIKSYLNDTYLAQSFDVFDEKTGAYDKKKRDAEPIGSMNEYLEAYPVFADYPDGSGYTLPYTDECMESVARIASMCEENGVTLTVVAAPVYADYLAYFAIDDVKNFYSSLASVTDFWDFSYSSVSFEPRYFYDSTHFRNAVGEMAAARVGGDTDVYVPDDFGHYVTAGNSGEYIASYGNVSALPAEEISADIPILMYHHISDTDVNDMTVTPDEFEDQIRALDENGYSAITFDELYGYVTGNGELPENPILITFDDGYYSNYKYAYPILEKYGMCGTIFTIGYSFGCDTYKDTDAPIIPHFGEDEVREMVESGVIDIQSHTFSMHESADYEVDDVREDMSQLEGESESDYIEAVREDIRASIALLEDAAGEDVFVLAYPKGYYSDLLGAVIREEGIRITLSTEWGVNTVVRGLPQSLYALKRLTVGNGVTGDSLIAILSEFDNAESK